MIKRTASAALRATLVAFVIAFPALVLPGVKPDSVQIVALVSLVAALLTFVEYWTDYPSFIEFRSAPPLNRMRFLALFSTVVLLTLICREQMAPAGFESGLSGFGDVVGAAMDFPFSPVRLMVLVAQDDAMAAHLRVTAGLAYTISLIALLTFVAVVRLLDWPIRNGAFNVWVNLPLFDPTAGGDVLRRLKRDSHVNVALGFLLPFLVPAVLQLVSTTGMPVRLNDPQTLIWVVTVWAFIPSSLIMRGVALMRIADLIEEKRRRAYAQAELLVA